LKFFSKKEKTCENAVFTQALELIVGLEPTTCALRNRRRNIKHTQNNEKQPFLLYLEMTVF